MNPFIIFDCDGVLVDSEIISNQIFCDMLCSLGLSLKLQNMFDTFVGHSMKSCYDILEQDFKIKIPHDFHSKFREKINIAFEQDLRAVSGIKEVLDNISYSYCVASNGSYEKMQMTLQKSGLSKYFDTNIYSAYDKNVNKPKPSPDVYLYAASKSKIDPQDCLVIEDTPLGVKSAVNAGMKVLGYSAMMKRERLLDSGAVDTFDDMKNLLEKIESIKPS